MNKKKIIGIVLVVVAIIGFLSWEIFLREAATYDEVIVLNQSVEPGEIITKKMVTHKKISEATEGAFLEGEEKKVIGSEATQYIEKNTELFSKYITVAGMALGEDNLIISIPNAQLKSYPQTLRRGDEAYIYTVKPEEIKDDTLDEKNVKESVEATEGEFLLNALVSYVKDNGNAEVKSNDKDRLTGSAVVATVELIVTKNQAKTIAKAIADDCDFVIAYN